jgi:hypothetical protein
VTQEVGSGKLGVQKRGKWEYGGKKKWEVGSFVLSGKSNFAANKKKIQQKCFILQKYMFNPLKTYFFSKEVH